MNLSVTYSSTSSPSHSQQTQDEEPLLWPMDALKEDALGAHGYILTYLHLYPDLWIHRRVEAIKPEGSETCSYETVDFSLPEAIVNRLRAAGQSTAYVPLAIMTKAPLAHFNICDESGRNLCVLTQDQNTAFSRELLHRLAKLTLINHLNQLAYFVRGQASTLTDIHLDPELAKCLAEIVDVDAEHSHKAIKALKELRYDDPCGAFGQAAILWADETIKELIRSAARGYLLIVSVPAVPGRQLIKYSYSVTTRHYQIKETYQGLPEESDKKVTSLTFGLKWWEYPWLYDIWDVLYCSSYHLEITAPPSLELKDVEWFIKTKHNRSFSFKGRGAYLPSRVNLHVTPQSAPAIYGSDVIQRSVKGQYRLPRRGLLTMAVISTFITTMLLWALGNNATHGAPGTVSAGISALLAAVGFGNIYISRRDEHPAEGLALSGLRMLLLSSGLASLGGVILLLDGVDNFWPWWGILVSMSGIVWGYICVGWKATGRDPEG